MDKIVSRQYKPNPAKCCEACVFGRGEHAAWCTVQVDLPWDISVEKLDELLTKDLGDSH